MNNIFAGRLSSLLSIAALTQLSVGIAIVGNGLSAQAETMDKVSTDALAEREFGGSKATGIAPLSLPAPVPGTTATSIAPLTSESSVTPQMAPASETAASRVAQADTNTEPIPGVEPTTPSQDSAPAPTPADTDPIPSIEPTTPSQDSAPAPTPTTAVSLPDVGADYWAYPFIQALAARNVIAGFPDGTFKPDQTVTRAEFASMLQKAFQQNPVRQLSPGGFTDVPADYWAASAIQTAYEAGFLAGYPDNTFLPNQEIPKVEAITGLASGLGLFPSGSAADIVSTTYTDAALIPPYAVNAVAAATQANVVVNYPDVKVFNPITALTRAEAAAHLYQALVRQGQVQPLPSNVAAANYIVGGSTGVSQTPPTTETTPSPDTDTDTAQSPDTDVEPGQATRGGSSYVGVAGNIGLTGESALGDTNFAVISKIGITNSISARPSVVIGDDVAVLVPLTYDLSSLPLIEAIPLSPYLGAGVAISTGDGTDVGPMLTVGVDLPITTQFTATAGVNVGFLNDTDVGLVIGVGYNFSGLFGL